MNGGIMKNESKKILELLRKLPTGYNKNMELKQIKVLKKRYYIDKNKL